MGKTNIWKGENEFGIGMNTMDKEKSAFAVYAKYWMGCYTMVVVLIHSILLLIGGRGVLVDEVGLDNVLIEFVKIIN